MRGTASFSIPFPCVSPVKDHHHACDDVPATPGSRSHDDGIAQGTDDMTASREDGWRPLRRWEMVLVAMAGALILAWAGLQSWRTLDLLARGQRTHGVVVENAGHPLIRFTTTTGNALQFVQNGGASGEPGASIGVVYDPVNPASTARADTFFALWGGILGLLPAGFGCLAVAFLGGEIRRTGRFGR